MIKEIKIEGMKCMHCASAVKSAIEKISGVNSADINLENKSATVDFQENVSLEEIVSAIENQGFDVI